MNTTNAESIPTRSIQEWVTVFACDLKVGDIFEIPSMPPYDYDFSGVVQTVERLPEMVKTGGYYGRQFAYLITGLALGKTGRESTQWLRLERETIRVKRARLMTDGERIAALEAAVDSLAAIDALATS